MKHGIRRRAPGRRPARSIGHHPRVQRGRRPRCAVRAAVSGARRTRHVIRSDPDQRRQPRPLGRDARRSVPRPSRHDAHRAAHHGSTWRSSPASRNRAARSSSRSTPTCRTRRGNRQADREDARGLRLRRLDPQAAPDSLWRRKASQMMNRLRERITRIKMTDQAELRAYSRRIIDTINVRRSQHVHPRPRVHVRAETDRNRGRARGALRRRVEILAVQPDPAELRPRDGLSVVPLQWLSFIGVILSLGSAALFVLLLVRRFIVGA